VGRQWWNCKRPMSRRLQTRCWWRVGACALLGFALSVAAFASSATTASADPASKQSSKPKHTSHSSKAGSKAGSKANSKTASSHKTTHAASKQATASAASKKKSSRGKKSSKSTRTARKRGQQGIDHDRARAIQEALIREHYLQGEPTGSWDSATQSAMQRYQADQGWQSKTTPDSRALIKLGLGPSNDHLLNPESAMTSTPPADPKSAPKQDPPADPSPQQ